MKRRSEIELPSAKYIDQIYNHYVACWNNQPSRLQLKEGPANELPPNFCVLEFAPSPQRNMWTYATCGMSNQNDAVPLELHLFSPIKEIKHVELLTAIVHYHLTGAYLNLDHTVNFGRPWLPNSECDHGLISLPYLDGPKLEWLKLEGHETRFLWLIPITASELTYKKGNGIKKLEEAFDKNKINYLDASRSSVI